MPTSHDPLISPGAPLPAEDFLVPYFSELLRRPICTGKIDQRLGRLRDLVFQLAEPYPECVGIYLEHGWGKPSEFIPWDKVIKIDEDAIFVAPAEEGGPYPPFVDQPGWILVREHLMGRTILDMDGRRTEVVNDVHMLASKGRMIIIHVDVSFNGFLRKWRLGRWAWSKDRLISWRYVQPLSLEDVGTTDVVSLSVTHKQIKELPGEDLADALATLSGKEQQAVFSALDAEKAAEVLHEAQPRAQRQLVASLRREKATTILSEMSIPQLADLFSVLPHNDMMEMMELLPKETAQRIRGIISDRESTARDLMSTNFVAMPKDAKAGDVLRHLRESRQEHDAISYIYVVVTGGYLAGVVDLRELVLALDDVYLADIMVSPVVTAQETELRENLADLFAKYHFRMLPIVDPHNRLLGVIHFKDIMKGLVTRVRV